MGTTICDPTKREVFIGEAIPSATEYKFQKGNGNSNSKDLLPDLDRKSPVIYLNDGKLSVIPYSNILILPSSFAEPTSEPSSQPSESPTSVPTSAPTGAPTVPTGATSAP